MLREGDEPLAPMDLALLANAFEKAAQSKKEGVLDFFDRLMVTLHSQMEELSVNQRSPSALQWAEAFDLVYQAKAAVEGNTNPKLAVTFVATRLSHIQGLTV